MMLKKMRLIIIVIMVIFLMSGCNLKEKISENITEEIVEKASGGEVDVKIDGEDVTFESEDGDVTINEDSGVTIEGEDGIVVSTGGVYEWPTDQAAVYLPKLDVGTITYILNGPEACMLLVEGVVLKDYESYKETVIDKGYTNDKFESSSDEMEMYTGADSDGVAISVSFTTSEGNMQITVNVADKQ